MRRALGAGAAGAAFLIAAAQAQGEGDRAADAARDAADWGAWTRPLARSGEAAVPAAGPAPAPAPEFDVVDAHWMALTMWGEARAEGEAGMRAVGHVIDNRRRVGMHGAYVTDTVGEAFQFSCWNPGDPNREAMLNVEALPPASEDGRSWRLARRLAGEIMAGRSDDPTGGALYYHTTAVSPRWSRGLAPVLGSGTTSSSGGRSRA